MARLFEIFFDLLAQLDDEVVDGAIGRIGLDAPDLVEDLVACERVAGAAGDDARLDAALRFGAAKIVDVSKQSLLDTAKEETGGAGLDVAFECAGHETSVRACIEALRPMGRYTQVGICGHEIKFPMDQVFFKQLKLCGSVCYTAQTWDRMMKIFQQGRVKLGDLISNKLPISEWRTAFDLCTQKQALKVLMYPES